MKLGLPREVAEKIDHMRRRKEFRESQVKAFESVSDYAMRVRARPCELIDDEYYYLFDGVNRDTFAVFAYHKSLGKSTMAWEGIYEAQLSCMKDAANRVLDPADALNSNDEEEYRMIMRKITQIWFRNTYGS